MAAKPSEDKCEERLQQCNVKFSDMKTLFMWVIGGISTVFLLLTFGSYGYTYRVADEQKTLVTKEDFKDFKKEIIQAVKEVKGK